MIEVAQEKPEVEVTDKRGQQGPCSLDEQPKQDRLAVVEAKIKELEPKKDDREVRKELGELYKEKIKLTTPVTDFKVCEIWIKSGQIFLEASEAFWSDRVRALGLLEFVKDIVKEAKVEKPRPKIMPFKGAFKNWVRGLGRKKR